MTYAAILDDTGLAQQPSNLKLAAKFAALKKESDALPRQGNIAALLRRLATGKCMREIFLALGIAAFPSHPTN